MYVRAHAISTSEMISTMGTHYRTGRRGTKQKRDFYIKINGASIPYYFFWGTLSGCVGWDCRKGEKGHTWARLSEKGKTYTRAWRRRGGEGGWMWRWEDLFLLPVYSSCRFRAKQRRACFFLIAEQAGTFFRLLQTCLLMKIPSKPIARTPRKPRANLTSLSQTYLFRKAYLASLSTSDNQPHKSYLTSPPAPSFPHP
jgi:hypothetical protein